MRFGNTVIAAALAASIVGTPVMAAANPAAGLSVVQNTRAGSAVTKKNDLAGGGLIVAIIAAAAVIVGIIVVADNNDKPHSP